jgi:hypothetical protein
MAVDQGLATMLQDTGQAWTDFWGGVGDAWGTVTGAKGQADAIKQASTVQTDAAQAGIDLQREQFNKLQELLAPYTTAGVGALQQQRAMLGLLGPEAQKASIAGIQNSSEFGALAQQGENSILQNASATGGLRGGNTQAALAQFRPAMLNQLINQRYGQLGGLAGLGQASAAGVGAAGQQFGQSASGLLGQMGAAQAGGILGQQNAYAQASPLNVALGGLGVYTGLGGKIF